MAELSTTLDWIGFSVLASICVIGAFQTVRCRRLVHAALWLGATMMGVAGFFMFLGSEFLAGIQVLIYVGAILTLILFAIMFTTNEEEEEEAERQRQDLEGGDPQ